jgi:hypothetical protein
MIVPNSEKDLTAQPIVYLLNRFNGNLFAE